MSDNWIRSVVWVEWVDSYGSGGWRQIEDARVDDLRIASIGFLIHEDDQAITISTSLTPKGSTNDPLTIPRCAITKLQKVSFQ